MKKLIIISDWAADALARQEVRSTVQGYLLSSKNPYISYVPATPSGIHTGYLLAQIVQTEERYGKPIETVIYQHTDTRADAATSREDSRGADFFVTRLATGLYICGPNAGHVYSFIRSKIHKLYWYSDIDLHTRHRARDAYARIVSHLMDSLEDELDLEETHTNRIPAVQNHYIGHVDSHGTLKTTISQEELKGRYEFEQEVRIQVQGVEKKARFLRHLFVSTPGELVLFPGSSGDKHEPYLDISIWQDYTKSGSRSAWQEFGSPKPGTPVQIL